MLWPGAVRAPGREKQDPAVRLPTLFPCPLAPHDARPCRLFKELMTGPESERAELRALNAREQEIVRERGEAGDGDLCREFYADQLPSRSG